MWFKTPKLEAVLFLPVKNYWWLVVELKQQNKITPKYTGPNFRKSITLRHFEVEVVRECFIKELVYAESIFWGLPKSKMLTLSGVLRYSTWLTKCC